MRKDKIILPILTLIGCYDNFKVSIFNDGETLPHFHVYSESLPNYSVFDSAIRLDSAKYLFNKGRGSKLNFKQKENLIKFLSSKNSNSRVYTNYDYAVVVWNEQNNIKVKVNQKMPNYLELKE